jgi:chitodextrinase
MQYSDTTVSANTQYSYVVKARDPSNNTSGPSNTATVTTPGVDTVDPLPPSNLNSTAVSSGRVDLTWDAGSDNVGVTAYDIYRGGNLLTLVDGSTLAYSDLTVTGGIQYSYTVQARDAAGNTSIDSNVAQATTPSAGVVFQDDFESGSLLNWSTVAGLAGSAGATDGLATSARFNFPIGVVSDGVGASTQRTLRSSYCTRIQRTVGDSEVACPSLEHVAERHRAERRVAARAAAADREPLAVDDPLGGQEAGSGHAVGEIDDAPFALEPLPIRLAIAGGTTHVWEDLHYSKLIHKIIVVISKSRTILLLGASMNIDNHWSFAGKHRRRAIQDSGYRSPVKTLPMNDLRFWKLVDVNETGERF